MCRLHVHLVHDVCDTRSTRRRHYLSNAQCARPEDGSRERDDDDDDDDDAIDESKTSTCRGLRQA